MIPSGSNKKIIQNKQASLTVDLFGGAIVNFHLNDEEKINPLSFTFTKEQMPENNKSGAVYQGHFLCLPRWGAPSEGEIKAGIPNHGQFANILWQSSPQSNPLQLQMDADAALESMYVNRTITLSKHSAVFEVKEIITNAATRGRLYNMVQHPTLTAPFLKNLIIINCNATKGFQQFSDYNKTFNYPVVQTGNLSINLTSPITPCNSVFSFIVNKKEEYGWITTYNAEYKLLFGYIWKREQYPWIHLWQHFEENKIKYLGLEFGTAGIHQPFKKILEKGIIMFDTKTVEYIDADEKISRDYICFLYKASEEIKSIMKVELNKTNNDIIIYYNDDKQLNLSVSF